MGDTFVDNIENAVLLFSNPFGDDDSSAVVRNITALSDNLSYHEFIDDNITTLTSRFAATQQGRLQGLLYVPDLDESDPCYEVEQKYVPKHVVRQAQLPPTDYNLIALAPWISANCTKSYLQSARSDPLRAFITYLPHDNATGAPPGPEDSAWNLRDGGAWTKTSLFPIYAVPGPIGRGMMLQAGSYSGNITSVPFGASIQEQYDADPDDYVRIWTEIAIVTPEGSPSKWIYILVCAAVLVTAVVGVTYAVHRVNKRRRITLRKRVLAGDVNLEALNLGRIAVPSEHLQRFPLFTYSDEQPELAEEQESEQAPPAAEVYGAAQSTTGRSTAGSITATPKTSTGIAETASTDHQPHCTLCTFDFINRVTIVRELPCGHIFHPRCIDSYLCNSSSCCPVCKMSMLPLGFCPPITAEMVRRERALRKLRPNADDGVRWWQLWTALWRDVDIPMMWRRKRRRRGSEGFEQDPEELAVRRVAAPARTPTNSSL